MGKTGGAEGKTPGAAGKPGAFSGGRPLVDAAGRLRKAADFINLAKGIGKHVAVAAVYRNHPGRGGDFCLAEATAEKFPLVAAIGLFFAFPLNPAIKVELPGPPEKQTGIKTEPL